MPNHCLVCALNSLERHFIQGWFSRFCVFDWFLFACERTQDDCILTCLITAIVMLVLGLKATAEVFSLCHPLLLPSAPLKVFDVASSKHLVGARKIGGGEYTI